MINYTREEVTFATPTANTARLTLSHSTENYFNIAQFKINLNNLDKKIITPQQYCYKPLGQAQPSFHEYNYVAYHCREYAPPRKKTYKSRHFTLKSLSPHSFA
jgi:hypothetical protein